MGIFSKATAAINAISDAQTKGLNAMTDGQHTGDFDGRPVVTTTIPAATLRAKDRAAAAAGYFRENALNVGMNMTQVTYRLQAPAAAPAANTNADSAAAFKAALDAGMTPEQAAAYVKAMA